MRRQMGFALDIFMIGKGEAVAVRARFEPKGPPKRNETDLHVGENALIAALARYLDRLAQKRIDNASTALIWPYGGAFEFHEVGEPPQTQCADWFVVDMGEQMR